MRADFEGVVCREHEGLDPLVPREVSWYPKPATFRMNSRFKMILPILDDVVPNVERDDYEIEGVSG